MHKHTHIVHTSTCTLKMYTQNLTPPPKDQPFPRSPTTDCEYASEVDIAADEELTGDDLSLSARTAAHPPRGHSMLSVPCSHWPGVLLLGVWG